MRPDESALELASDSNQDSSHQHKKNPFISMKVELFKPGIKNRSSQDHGVDVKTNENVESNEENKPIIFIYEITPGQSLESKSNLIEPTYKISSYCDLRDVYKELQKRALEYKDQIQRETKKKIEQFIAQQESQLQASLFEANYEFDKFWDEVRTTSEHSGFVSRKSKQQAIDNNESESSIGLEKTIFNSATAALVSTLLIDSEDPFLVGEFRRPTGLLSRALSTNSVTVKSDLNENASSKTSSDANNDTQGEEIYKATLNRGIQFIPDPIPKVGTTYEKSNNDISPNLPLESIDMQWDSFTDEGKNLKDDEFRGKSNIGDSTNDILENNMVKSNENGESLDSIGRKRTVKFIEPEKTKSNKDDTGATENISYNPNNEVVTSNSDSRFNSYDRRASLSEVEIIESDFDNKPRRRMKKIRKEVGIFNLDGFEDVSDQSLSKSQQTIETITSGSEVNSEWSSIDEEEHTIYESDEEDDEEEGDGDYESEDKEDVNEMNVINILEDNKVIGKVKKSTLRPPPTPPTINKRPNRRAPRQINFDINRRSHNFEPSESMVDLNSISYSSSLPINVPIPDLMRKKDTVQDPNALKDEKNDATEVLNEQDEGKHKSSIRFVDNKISTVPCLRKLKPIDISEDGGEADTEADSNSLNIEGYNCSLDSSEVSIYSQDREDSDKLLSSLKNDRNSSILTAASILNSAGKTLPGSGVLTRNIESNKIYEQLDKDKKDLQLGRRSMEELSQKFIEEDKAKQNYEMSTDSRSIFKVKSIQRRKVIHRTIDDKGNEILVEVEEDVEVSDLDDDLNQYVDPSVEPPYVLSAKTFADDYFIEQQRNVRR